MARTNPISATTTASAEISLEQIEQELSKELIRYTGHRRNFSSLTEERVSQTHRDLIKKNADIHRRATPFFYAMLETAFKAADVATVAAPGILLACFENFKNTTGFEVLSFDRFTDSGTGQLDINKVSDMFGKITSFGTGSVQSAKHIHDNITTGEKTELKGHEDQARSQSDFKRQELLRIISDEQQALQKFEQSQQRRHEAKRAIVAH